MPKHKSEDFKLSAVEYYLTEDVSQEQVCRIFKCNPRSLIQHPFFIFSGLFSIKIEKGFSCFCFCLCFLLFFWFFLF